MSARYRQTNGTAAGLSCSKGRVRSIAFLMVEGEADDGSVVRKSLCHARDSLPQCVMLLSKKRVYLISRHRPYVQCLCAVGEERKTTFFDYFCVDDVQERPNNKSVFTGQN